MNGATSPKDGASVGLEDKIRRMILFNGSVPDDGAVDARPRVRLPPSAPGYGQQPPSPGSHINGTFHHQRSMNGCGPASPSSPLNQGLPPPTTGPSMFAPHMAAPSPHMAPPGFIPPHARHAGPHTYPQPQLVLAPPAALPPNLRQNRGAYAGPPTTQRGNGRGRGMPRQQRNQQIQLDPDAFQRGGAAQGQARSQAGARNLYDPNARYAQLNFVNSNTAHQKQAEYLDHLVASQVPNVEMSQSERDEKDELRLALQKVCQQVCASNPNLPKVSLECFGSFQSGFASAGSDMDLVIVVQDQGPADAIFSMLEDGLPRSLEKELLRAGFGARLLTRTRVPIIKICQSPGGSLLDKLREEREKWDSLPHEQKYPHLYKEDDTQVGENALVQGEDGIVSMPQPGPEPTASPAAHVTVPTTTALHGELSAPAQVASVDGVTHGAKSVDEVDIHNNSHPVQARRDQQKSWTRERKAGPLDFPKDGIGIQCDINFSNPLGLHNTQMLRCYSKCDPRVRPIVLFMKSWAKQRKINSSYSGTLSSYGYVLMVLHYLINVVRPPVLPNLQMQWRPHTHCTPPGRTRMEVDGWVVDFWRNENEIESALRNGQMSANSDSIGSLLAGLFQYYSSMGNGPQFRWTQQVLSLRTPGGVLTKGAKGWVKATTEEGEGKRIQHRYLFCIEDPFEHSHNVARTVTHNGIVAIRDEFRRAYRILNAVAQNDQLNGAHGAPSPEGDLFDKLLEDDEEMIEVEKRDRETLSVNKIVREDEGDVADQKDHHHGSASTRRKNGKRDNSQQRKNGLPLSQPNKQLDVADQEAFPSLGAAKGSSRRKKSSSASNFNEISGNQAQEYLEEFRRKKVEEQAERTAYGAAESVLNGLD